MIAGFVSTHLIAKDTLSDFKFGFIKQNAAKKIDPNNPLSHARVYIQTPDFPVLQLNQNIFFSQYQAQFQQICEIPRPISELNPIFLTQNSEMKQMYKALANLQEVISENIDDEPLPANNYVKQPLKEKQPVESLYKQNMYNISSAAISKQIYSFNQKEENQSKKLENSFMEQTGSDAQEATFYLSACNYNLPDSITMFKLYHQS